MHASRTVVERRHRRLAAIAAALGTMLAVGSPGQGVVRCAPARTLPGLIYQAVAYDRARARTVLFGGGGFGSTAVTWEWDGTTWTQRAPAGTPPGRFSTAMAYDATAGRVLMFGGAGVHPSLPIASYHGDTWLYGELRTPTAAPIGSACTGTNGPPLLASDGPYLGAPAFALDLFSARASSPCAFGLATGTQNLAIGGGCTLCLRTPITTLLAAANASGFASTRFAVPVDPALRGAVFYAQAFVADPQGAAGGLAVTAGRRLTCGDRSAFSAAPEWEKHRAPVGASVDVARDAGAGDLPLASALVRSRAAVRPAQTRSVAQAALR